MQGRVAFVAPERAGLPAGTLVPPALSGTITTSLSLQPVTFDEPNTTPYQGSGTLPVLFPAATTLRLHSLDHLFGTEQSQPSV